VFTPTRTLRRVLSITTAIGLALPSFAQTPNVITPPARVGQVANLSGSVSYNGAGSNGQWVAATANYPLTDGDSLFTQSASQAAIAIDASLLTLGPNTELQINTLDDTSLTATESQGEVFLNLTGLQPGETTTINTPRGAVTLTQNGAYDIAAGDAGDPTTVAVLAGAASIGQLEIPAGQEGYITGTDQPTAQLGALQRDAFMNSVLGESSPPPPPYVPPVVQQMTGAAELSTYGSWDQSPQYGAVWYPSVDSGWAPYREGHWAFVAPWGWTWVDVEPWGFAPFHYGRWIQEGGRWGWCPASAYGGGDGGGYGGGGYYRPVYAPAVVSFFGIGAGVAITAAILSRGDVGWVPLGPGEAYHPYYHADPHYIQQINRVDVRDYQHITINNIHNTTIINNYANHNGATYIQASDMARGESVRHYGHPVTGQMFAQARPVEGSAFNQGIRPDYAPRAAEAPRPTDFAQRHDIPAPAVSRQPFQPGFRPQGGEAMHPQGAFSPANPQAPGFPPQAGQPFRPQAPDFQKQPMPAYHQPEQSFHPQAMPAFHPPAEQFHPQDTQLPHVYQPEQQYHAPQAPAFHPQDAQTPHVYAPPQQFHAPEAPAYHPPEQSFHPENAPAFHPQEMPSHVEQAPRPNDTHNQNFHN
jgi:hypothetical protein